MANNDMDRVVPLGQLDDYKVADGDPDVRGWEVLSSDGRKIGEVDELLVDTNAMKVRYLDVDVEDGVIGDGMDRHVLIPIGYARLEQERDCVMVDGLASADLQGLPAYDQGPLTRDFESSVRDSFSGRRADTTGADTTGTGMTAAGMTAAGMSGAGAGMLDTAGMDNTPGTGTGLGMAGAATRADVADAGARTGEHHLGDGVPEGAGMRNAGYDLDRGTHSPLQAGSPARDTGSPRTGPGSAPAGGTSAGAANPGHGGSDLGGGPFSGAGTEVEGAGRGDAMRADDDVTLAGGMSAGAGSQGPAAGMGTDRGPQGDVSHRAGTGSAGSDYQHNADEDFYASDAFDDSRFYGARRGGPAGGGLGGSPASGTGLHGDGMSALDRGGMNDGMGADRDETARLAREAAERLREDERNRGAGGSGTR